MLAQKRLVDLIEADLQAGPAVAGGNIQRQGMRPLAAGTSEMVALRVVRSHGRPVMLSGEAPLEWQTLVAVGCVARAAAGQAPDEAVAGLLAAVHGRISGSAALAAAGYRVHPEHHLEWDQEELEDRIGAVTAIYTVRHLGAITSIDTAA